MTRPPELRVNGERHALGVPGATLLSDYLRDELELTGTKVGCGSGDCGACTVMVDDDAVCACLVPVGRIDGCHVTTVEGLADDAIGAQLQASFIRHGAAQCGFCTPGMLLAARALLAVKPQPCAADVEHALGGVLCRCTGYRSIIEAVLQLDAVGGEDPPPRGKAVGASMPRVDALEKVTGADTFGADRAPAGALVIRAVRSPHARARFAFGDLDAYRRERPGVHLVLTASDVPGVNRFGVIPSQADQPVFAEGEVRFQGEAVAAVVFDPDGDTSLDAFPVRWEPLEPLRDIDSAVADDAPLLHSHRPGNVLAEGVVARGDVDKMFAACAVVASGTFTTPFLEHAYLEPEAGWAEIVDAQVVIHVCTQAPYLDLESTADILGVPHHKVRIVPTAVGGGFGGKLDLSVHPYVALAALRLECPVRMVYDRGESMATTTKRHPATMRVKVGAGRDGIVRAVEFAGAFDTGAYASWGPTVANRVPVHASGPYFVEHYRARAMAVHTHQPPSGAFRGFGVPQGVIAQESMFDDVAIELGIDRLEFRIRNALSSGRTTVTGQRLERGVGIRDCLEALRDPWADAHDRISATQRSGSNERFREGVGIAAVWYGCGNTAMSNPSTIKAGLRPDGRIVLHQGAVDLGQGSNTVISQIFADAISVDVSSLLRAPADTSCTPDAGKTSASRQTFVSGNAALRAGRSLRAQLLGLMEAPADCEVHFDGHLVIAHVRGEVRSFDLRSLPVDADGYVLRAVETYDPPTTELDAQGQGAPYAVYGFGAQMVELAVDTCTGRTRLDRITAAYDVGRAINPQLVRGQLEGGIAQGIGLALMEAYLPGRTNNLHDYLIPTIGDVPPIRTVLVESDDPEGPFGAKGVGEHALIATAPAILSAIRHACGARVTSLPATPDRVLDAIRARA